MLCAVLLAGPSAAAGRSASPRAEALVREARRQMDEQDFLGAKGKLEESIRISPAPATLFHLGTCYERLGLPANAFAAYRDSQELATSWRQNDRARMAAAKLGQLKKTVGLVTIVVSEPGATATVDGVPIETAKSVPLEEGRHALRVAAPGRVVWQNELRAEKGERIRIVVPSLSSEAQAAPSPAKVIVERDEDEDEPSSPPDPRKVRQVFGLAVAGVGVLGLGAGAVLGLSASSSWSETDAHCNQSVCDARGVQLTQSARTAATWSTVATVAGVAAVAGGLVIYFTAPRSEIDASLAPRAAFMVTPHGGALGVGKAF